MERASIFSIHTIISGENPEYIIINGRALDKITVGSKLYSLDTALDEKSCTVVAIDRNAEDVSSLGVMDFGTISIKTENELFLETQYLYGELVNKYIPTITFDQAKRMAQESAKEDLSQYVKDSTPFLAEVVLEGECCWFFFHNPDIEIPEYAWATRMLSVKAVSKKGDMNKTYNYSDDPIKLNDYLQTMSSYFKRKGT
ncbi:hypothetical protein [Cohnella hashimotonis]|uniref:Uncharacterized protein n=1 Tax=Cohnella hashimotonis TaxID=2826895 RepID=A0ABT6TKU2_9BACL|nr:hypothetical protein [Cohnella hashimotonis]MDI4647478.1 hypothetical protein [Cohnella hashimotonis]